MKRHIVIVKTVKIIENDVECLISGLVTKGMHNEKKSDFELFE